MMSILSTLVTSVPTPAGACEAAAAFDPQWVHAIANGAIAIGCFAIAVVLALFALRRADLPIRPVVGILAALVALRGAMLVVETLVPGFSVSLLAGVAKLLFALPVLVVPWFMARLLPRALAMPSHLALADANARLEGEIKRHKKTENELMAAYVNLERNVAERTVELSETNARLEREVGEHRNTHESLRANESLLLRLHEGLEEKVASRTIELTRTISELESFSYSISHDLRTPLRAINGYAAILREEYLTALDPRARELTARIEANASRMAKLIDGLLDFARLGRIEVLHAEVDMTHLARSIAAEQNPEGAGAAIDIGELPAAAGDAMMLGQVFANLLSNALKFSAGKPNPVIAVGGEKRGAEKVYWVQDNGVGFDMAYLEKLFGVFSRLHRADEYPGVGVGLAIVRRIVLRHGGRVWAASRAGEGSTFYFALPEIPPASPIAQAP